MNKKTLAENRLKVLYFKKNIDKFGVTKLTPVLLIPANQEDPTPFDPRSPHHLLSRRRIMRNKFNKRP